MDLQCRQCLETKGRDEFDPRQRVCKECRRANKRAYWRANPEKLKHHNQTYERKPDLWTEKRCAGCRIVKSADEFPWQNEEKQWRNSRCRDCANAWARGHRQENLETARKYGREWAAMQRKRDPEQVRIYEMRRRCKKYGVTVEWLASQTEKQKGVCALCLRPEVTKSKRDTIIRSLAIDHCHKDGTARGLLCGACNQAVGKIESAPGWLDRATEYLKRD